MTAICDQCGKEFSNVYTLKAHRNQVHEGLKEFACKICNTKFTTKYKLKRHHSGVHSEKRDYHCTTCGHSFKTRDMMVKHQRQHQGVGPFRCDLCEKTFKFLSGLEHHNRLKHSIKMIVLKDTSLKPTARYNCSICRKKFGTLHAFQRHVDSHNDDSEKFLECTSLNCSKVFKNSKDLAKHEQNVHTGLVFYGCSYCLKQYKSKSNFEIHIASHEKGNEMQDYEYVIDEEDEGKMAIEEVYEGETCAQNDNYTDHDDYSGIPKSLLKNIDESIVSIVKIETEIFIPELSDTEKGIEDEKYESEQSIVDIERLNRIEHCDENCLEEVNDGMDFYETIIAEELETAPLNESDLIPHNGEFILTDSILLQDSNSFINSKTINVSNVEGLEIQRVKKPKPKTSNDKQSVCDECGAIFKNNSHLKRHVERKHRKDHHNLECDVCGLKFLLNYDLKRHMVKHSSIRNFKCEICGQQFKTELSLKNHIKVLHNSKEKAERKFFCKFCERSYFHQRHLDYHLRYANDICSKLLNSNLNFFRKHTGDKRYKCDLCKPEKSFLYSDAVKWHKIRHHGEAAPFSCSICSKKFIHEKSLNTHKNEHGTSGSLAVNCPTCGKSVSEKRHLKRHSRVHKPKEFRCQCGVLYKERHQLTKYLSPSCVSAIIIKLCLLPFQAFSKLSSRMGHSSYIAV